MATSEFSSGVARIIAKQAVIGRGAARRRATESPICCCMVAMLAPGAWPPKHLRRLVRSWRKRTRRLVACSRAADLAHLKVDVRVTEGTLAPDCCQARHYYPPARPGLCRFILCETEILRSAPDGDVGPSRLALGPVAHRVDHGDPCDGCRGTDIRGDADTEPTGKPRRRVVEPDRDPDLHNRSNRIAVGHAARNRVRDLGRGVFVAWRSRLAHGRLALFSRLDEHARRIGADAPTTLAADGPARGSRRDAAFRREHSVHFLGDAGVLVDAHRPRGPPQKLSAPHRGVTRRGPIAACWLTSRRWRTQPRRTSRCDSCSTAGSWFCRSSRSTRSASTGSSGARFAPPSCAVFS